MDAFLAGITTIPYFKEIMVEDEYYDEGGYLDDTPMRSLFEDPAVDEIIAIDFTDYDCQTELERLYRTQMITLPFNSIDMFLLSSDMQLCLPNKQVFSQAVLLNNLLAAFGKDALEIEGRTYYRKPLHILRPKNLESMTISLKDSTAKKKYFELGQNETESLFASLNRNG
jgi:predicted acylesterase/phospholipase RssA